MYVISEVIAVGAVPEQILWTPEAEKTGVVVVRFTKSV